MEFGFACVSAALAMKVEDYYTEGRRAGFLMPRGGRQAAQGLCPSQRREMRRRLSGRQVFVGPGLDRKVATSHDGTGTRQPVIGSLAVCFCYRDHANSCKEDPRPLERDHDPSLRQRAVHLERCRGLVKCRSHGFAALDPTCSRAEMVVVARQKKEELRS